MLLLRYFSTDFDSDCSYTELWNSLSMIIYANLFEITKKCFFFFISWPILIWFALFGRANFGTLKFYTEFWNCSPLINYGNLCKFIPKNIKNCFFSLISWPILIWFALSGRAKFGTQNFEILLHWLFMVLYANEMKWCPFQGIKFLFFDQFKSVPHKIYDICCCEMLMSATSLTFWFIILNCVMQARPPRAFPLFNMDLACCRQSRQKRVSKRGVRLIHEGGLYTINYGILFIQIILRT